MKPTRILAITAWLACLLLSVGLVVHLARAGMDNPIPPLAQIPSTIGYCVSVEDLDGKLIGLVNVPLHKPDPAKLDEFKASLRSAITLIGHTTGRQDLIRAAATVELTGAPTTAADGCYMSCTCATPYYVKPALSSPTSRSGTAWAAARRNPIDGGGGGIGGCSGGCGSCEKCRLVCPEGSK